MRSFLIVLFVFCIGIFTHASLFPDFFYDGLGIKQNQIKSDIKKLETTNHDENDLITYINFENGQFKPQKITIQNGNYVAITNKNKKEFMFLESNNPLLSTPRNYGEGERLQVRIDTIGFFTVKDKNKPATTLSIEVVD